MKDHIVIAIKQTDWQEAGNNKKAKIKAFFNRFISGDIVPVLWQKISNPTIKWYVASLWTQQLLFGPDKIDQAKIDKLKSDLADASIKIVFTDNPNEDLKNAGLEPSE